MENKNITGESTPILLPEYGRNVQKMVRYLLTIEDRDLRNQQAKVVVGLMANLYPHKRDSQEFRNMLWDHLFMIAGLELDVDAPFEKPSPDQFTPEAQPLSYPQKGLSYKQYGRYAARMAAQIGKIEAPEDAADRQELSVNLARFMRQKSYDYNRDYPDNRIITADLRRFSLGKIELDPSVLEGLYLYHNGNNNNNNNKGARSNNNQNRRGKNGGGGSKQNKH
ncbi:MAG: DUF4290 domain-containing protein [Rikenellaceae bacterium]